jgi:ABC-2 type transport system permease protein
VLSWIPPFSAMLMPISMAQGQAGALQSVLTVVIMIVACAGVAVLAARIYERSVLNIGGNRSLRQARR